MRKVFLFFILLGVVPLNLAAQDDDVYFIPKKNAATANSSSHDTRNRPTYYAGSNRDVDEYNRRGNHWSHYQKIGTDRQGNDIIEFKKGSGIYPDSMYIDTTFVGRYTDTILDGDDDFSYADRMRMWDGFYDPWYYSYRLRSPYYWNRFYGYGWNAWYGWPYAYRWPGYYGWYDPWYYPGWYGWGYPYYGGYWAGYWGGGYWPYHHIAVSRHDGPAGWRSYSFGNRADDRQRGGRRSFSPRSDNSMFRSRDYPRDSGVNSNVFRGRNGSFTGRNESPTRSYTPTPSFPSGGAFGSSGGSFGGGNAGGARSGGSFGGGGGRFGHR